ncbi:hypothetical protein WJX77_002963 [Trebouxia sp. C0004]
MATLHAAATETLTSLADRSLATATASLACCDGLLKLASGRRSQLRQHCLALPHVQQSFNWDCGLACALMVLKSLGVSYLNMASLRSLCSTTSVWTVDLAHLMRHFGLDVTLATIMVGANPGYFREGFYMENMEEDQCRVTQLFKEAERAGINVDQRSVPLKELQACMLAGSHLIIALVDKQRLCNGLMWSRPASLQIGGANRMPIICGYGEAYTGHYVVICGYNADTDSFILQDPAAGCCNITVTSAIFENARKAYGTDEDLLIVPLAERQVASTDIHKVQVYGKTTLCERCCCKTSTLISEV